jgi:two-component system sensor histidine kinase VanS
VKRPAGVSVRLRLTLSYAAFLVAAGTVLLAIVWVFLLRYVPPEAVSTRLGFWPGRDDLVRAFAPRAAWGFVFLLVVGLLGGWLLAGRMLAPLDRITRATRRAAKGSLSHRIDLEGRQDEFRELADAFDAMLARLEAQVAEQQRFAANASHELRTPLAITRTLLEVARSDPEHDRAALIDRLLEVNARTIELTEALLTLSRSDEGSFQREPVDVSLLVDEAVETLLPLAERRGVAVEVSGEPAVTAGSYPLLLQMVTNLVHNAIVHNRAEGGVLWVGTASTGGFATLTVENTGPELPRHVVETLTEPFQRGPGRVRGGRGLAGGYSRGSRADGRSDAGAGGRAAAASNPEAGSPDISGHEGVGLGLAIVKSVCRAHGGDLTLEPRPGGGLVVTVALPSASDAGGAPA